MVLDLDSPKTPSDKICWHKLNGQKPFMPQYADKVVVSDYVAQKGYEDTLN